MAGMDPVNVDAMLARFAEHWSPKKIAQINDYDVRIVKLQGDFTWHKHDDTEELFLVLSGELTIQMRDRDVVLGPRELFVVPRGAEHCPRADTETAVLLLEPSSVINIGDAGGEFTAEVETLSLRSTCDRARQQDRPPAIPPSRPSASLGQRFSRPATMCA